MTATEPPAPLGDATGPTRTLVLGGGGLAGIAWEVGVLVGLADAGVDVTGADRIVGTSAGSVVGTLVATGVDLAAVHAQHQDAAAAAASTGAPASLDMAVLGAQLAAALEGAQDAREMRARIGAWAASVDTAPEAERREIIAARLPEKAWPDRDLRITAVDAGSGDLVVFRHGVARGPDGPVSTDVDLVDAVGSSCAVPGVWPPVTIDGHRYVDGGMASIVHVALADEPEPADRLLVIAPLDPPAGGPFASVRDEITRRRTDHPDLGVHGVIADEASLAAFGADVLAPASMPPAAGAGYVQGRAAAAEVARFWA